MRRDTLIFLAAVLVLILCLGVAGITATSGGWELRGYADATKTTALPYWMPRLGFNVDLRQYEGGSLDTALAQMRDAGANWVRQPVDWSLVEPEPGQYDWSALDSIITPFENDPTLRLVPVLSGAPDWAANPAAQYLETAPPQDLEAFADFARAFAERYGHVVDHYQIWDEPNLESGWGGLAPRPVEYLAVLSAAYEAIHGADPHAQVIAAALAPTTETGPRNLSDVHYLDQLLELGGGSVMDAAAGKPFGFDRPADDRTVSPDVLNFSRIILLRETLVEHGLDTMPLWASAWGWNSLPDAWTGTPSIWGAVTSDQQAAYSVAALDRAEREWPWLGGMVLHTWQPDAPRDDPQWGFAVLDPDGTPTALHDALTSRGLRTVAVDGLYAAANPFAAYQGAWRFGPLGADVGDQQDSQAEFRFLGSDVALQLREDDYVAYIFATVDGQPANALPVDGGGNSYLVLTSDTRQPLTGLSAVANSLTAGEHALRMIADRGWERWALAGFAVSSGNLVRPYLQLLAVALVASAISLAAVIISGRRVDWGPVSRFFRRIWQGLAAAGQLVLSVVAALVLLFGLLFTLGGVLPDLLRRDPVVFGVTGAAALLLYLSPPLLVAVAAAVVLLIIFFHRPDLGLVLVVAFTPFYLFPVELYRFAFPMAELLLLLLTIAWVTRRSVEWARGRQSSVTAFPGPRPMTRLARLTLLDWCVAAYLALGGLALIWSAQRGPALTELRVLFVEPALFYLILRTTARTERVLLGVVDALVISGLCVAVTGLLQFAFGASVVVAEGGSLRLASVFGSPNNAALFLERALPFAFIMVLMPLDRARRAVALIAFVVMVLALGLTLSAGGLFLGAPLALATVLILHFGKRGVIGILAMAVLLAGAAIVALQSERFARLGNLSAGTSFFRLRVWQSAAQMIADRPLTGIGLDQFLYAYRGQYIAPDAWQEPDLSHPHNLVLDFWLRLGLLGLVLLIVVQIAFWIRAIQVWRKSNQSQEIRWVLVIGAMGSMAGVLAHGMVDNSVFVNDLAIVFMMLLAIPSALASRMHSAGDAPMPTPESL